MLLNTAGTLYANYKFKVYNKKGGAIRKRRQTIRTINMSGNSTTSNCKRLYKEMFRASFKDALYKVSYLIGGTFDYDSTLKEYYFIYYGKEAKKEKGKIHSTGYYEKEIPDTNNRKQIKDKYIQILEERENVKQKRTKRTNKKNKHNNKRYKKKIRPNTQRKKPHNRTTNKTKRTKRNKKKK